MRRILSPLFFAFAVSLSLFAGCGQDGGSPSTDTGDIPDGEVSPDAGIPDGGTGDAGVTDGGLDLCRAVADDAGLTPPYYVERSVDMGLMNNIAGNRLMAADLDNDYYPDLIVHRVGHKDGSNLRDDPTGDPPYKTKYILMNRLWEGKGFVETTVQSKYGIRRDDPGLIDRSAHFAVAADIDNNGATDLFSGTYTDLNASDPGDRSEVLINSGTGVFSLGPEIPVYRDEGGSVTSGTFLDYDRDGNIDIFVGAFYKNWGWLESLPDRLFKGDGNGNFTDVTEQMGLMTNDYDYEGGTASKPTYGVTSCDINGDGNPDLLTSSYGREWNNLWVLSGDTYAEYGRMTGYAGDDITDYSDDQFYRCHCKLNPGACDPAPGKPSITCDQDYWTPGVDDQPWRLNGNTFTTICADIDNDLIPDVYHTEIRHWHIGRSSDPSQMLKNVPADNIIGFMFGRLDNQKTGLYRKQPAYNWNEGDISAAVFDFDNDGLPDVYLGDSDYDGTRDYMWRQKPDHTFYEVGKTIGVGMSRGNELTVADFDRDGDLDIVVSTSLMRWDTPDRPDDAWVHYFENRIGERSNSIEIKLIGGGTGKANKSAIGARVIITTPDGKKQMREVDGGHGHFGLQNDLVVHFGLGRNCTVSEIEIRWPDKDLTVEKFKDIDANWLYEIEEGAGAIKGVIPFVKKTY